MLVVPAARAHDPLAIGDVLALRLLPPFSARRDRHVAPARHRSLRTRPVRADDAGRTHLAAGGRRRVAARGGARHGRGRGRGVDAAASSDRVLMAVADALLAIPRLVLLLVCAALWQPGLRDGGRRARRHRVDGRGAAWCAPRCSACATHPYVDAATSLGARSGRVLWRHARAERARAGDRGDDARRGQCDPAGERAVVPRASACSRRRRAGGT